MPSDARVPGDDPAGAGGIPSRQSLNACPTRQICPENPNRGLRCLTGTMQEPQITYRHMEHSPALDARIAELAGKLDGFHPKITACHVVVDEVDRHKSKGNLFEVHVV